MLTLRIKEINIRNVSSIDEAANQLFSAPEVRKRTTELRLTPGLSRLGMSDLNRVGTVRPSAETKDLTISNITLREGLNALSRSNGKAVLGVSGAALQWSNGVSNTVRSALKHLLIDLDYVTSSTISFALDTLRAVTSAQEIRDLAA